MSERPAFVPDPPIRCRDYRIGCVGAGIIMAECHLAAYEEAGFPVVAIASRTPANAEEVAERWGIPTVHDDARGADRGSRRRDPRHRLSARPAARSDPARAAAEAHQGDPGAKAAGADFATAKAVDRARPKAAGKMLSVNQNMRYDQSMRVLKQILDRGALGEPVFATIDMHAIPHWQPFLADYDRLTLAQHERASPRRAALPVRRSGRDHTADAHGSAHHVRAPRRHHRLDAAISRPACSRCRSRMSGPARAQEGLTDDIYINWRVEGTEGVAKGTIGWPTIRQAPRR